ncbi:MAG: hypothetical protein M3N33_00855 [Actinomycetota bacterium]|nr:hypothetical protein [Actinomycetota bacterium]
MKQKRKQLQELRRLAEAKRQRDALYKPCPTCGQPPARMIWVDQATGLEDGTGKPPCPECRRPQERFRPDAFNVVEFFPVDPEEDGDGLARP